MYKNELVPTGATPVINSAITLFNAITTATVSAAVADSDSMFNSGGRCAFQLVSNGTSGAFTAAVAIQGSNDNINWLTLGTISVAGTATTAATDGLIIDAPWVFLRGHIAIAGVTGTGGTATLTVGV